MMRFGLLLPSLRGGGAERVMLLLANGLVARGYAVDLILSYAEGPYLKDVSPGVRVIDLKARRLIASVPALVRYMKHENPSVIVSALSHVNVIAVLAKKISRVPARLILTEHSNFTQSKLHSNSWREQVMGGFMRWAYPQADRVVAVSFGVAEDLAISIGLSRHLITVVYNPVVSPVLEELMQEPVEHPWFNDGGPPVILGVGRLTPPKDFPTLISAFSLLRKNYNARLVILGEGELRGQLERLIDELGLQGNVSLHGFVNNPYSFMRRSKLFVLSSAWEGFGNVLVEAMACGTPVVATNCPSGPSEILQNGKWGPIVKVGDVKALAAIMELKLNLIEHPDVAERAADFHIENAVDAYVQLMVPATKE